jgi:hypothetical protein
MRPCSRTGDPRDPVPFRIIRAFRIDGSADERCLVMTLELPLAPQRGQLVMLPGDSEPHAIDRVVVRARPAAIGPHGWEPGFKAIEAIEVELAPEPPNAFELARSAGWTPA